MMRLIPNIVTIENNKEQSVIQHNKCEYNNLRLVTIARFNFT